MIYIFSSVHEFYSFVPLSSKRQHTRKHILRPRAQNFFSSKCQLEYEIKLKFKYKRLIRLHGQRGCPLVDYAVHSGTNKMSLSDRRLSANTPFVYSEVTTVSSLDQTSAYTNICYSGDTFCLEIGVCELCGEHRIGLLKSLKNS